MEAHQVVLTGYIRLYMLIFGQLLESVERLG